MSVAPGEGRHPTSSRTFLRPPADDHLEQAAWLAYYAVGGRADRDLPAVRRNIDPAGPDRESIDRVIGIE